MNTLAAIQSALLTALTADLGTFDLSGNDQVKVGVYEAPPVAGVPFLAVGPFKMTGSECQTQAMLWYKETHTVTVAGWAPVTDSQTATQEARGRLLQSETQAAIDTARGTAGNGLWKCVDFEVQTVEPGAVSAKMPMNWGRFELFIRFSFRRAAGGGV